MPEPREGLILDAGKVGGQIESTNQLLRFCARQIDECDAHFMARPAHNDRPKTQHEIALLMAARNARGVVEAILASAASVLDNRPSVPDPFVPGPLPRPVHTKKRPWEDDPAESCDDLGTVEPFVDND